MQFEQCMWSTEMRVPDYCVKGFKEIFKIAKIKGKSWWAQGGGKRPSKIFFHLRIFFGGGSSRVEEGKIKKEIFSKRLFGLCKVEKMKNLHCTGGI